MKKFNKLALAAALIASAFAVSAHAGTAVDDLQDYVDGKPSGYTLAAAIVADTAKAIDQAKQEGNNVNRLKAKFRKLGPQAGKVAGKQV